MSLIDDTNDRSSRLPLRNPRSLLVEDEVVQLDQRKELLELQDLEVIPATSRVEAVERLHAVGYQVDVVITDLNLDRGSAGNEGGTRVAKVVNDVSGRGIPVYAYSGKTADLPDEARQLFKRVILKSDRAREVRRMFREASSDAQLHFKERAGRATEIADSLRGTTRLLSSTDVTLLRDVVAGAQSTSATTTPKLNRVLGVLELEDGLLVPYEQDYTLNSDAEARVRASVLGHEYIYGYGGTEEQAVASLQEVIYGYGLLVSGSEVAARGPSKRLRKFMRALSNDG